MARYDKNQMGMLKIGHFYKQNTMFFLSVLLELAKGAEWALDLKLLLE